MTAPTPISESIANAGGALRLWRGMIGWNGADEGAHKGPTQPMVDGSTGDTLIVAADPIAEMLLGDLPNVAIPSVQEMLGGDQRRRWAWSGSAVHWLPGTDGNPGDAPSRVVDLRAVRCGVGVNTLKCSPAVLDHDRVASLRQLCTVRTKPLEPGFSVTLIRPGAGAKPEGWRQAARRAIQGADVVLVDPERFRSGSEAAFVVACACAHGIPVWVSAWNPELVRWLAPSLVDELAACDPVRLRDDAYYRDLMGVRLRRHVLEDHSEDAIWRAIQNESGATSPSVVVMVSCIRPEYLPQVVRYLNDQTYRRFEARVIVDRVTLSSDIENECHELANFALVIEKNVEPVTVGEIYNRIMRSSDSDVAVIWDDDDHYAPEHLQDLVQALVSSRATIAGKWAEFFHLAGPDITIQRSPEGRYRDTPSIGGSNLAMWRSTVLAYGGFMPTTLGYDQELIERVRSKGGRTYRTHGYGYLATRRKSGHTWNPGDTYFLEQSVRQWPGLELPSVGFGSPRTTISGKKYR